MLKLYGFQFSNYVSMVQLALLEKGIAFDHIEFLPDRSNDLLAKSPRGKVPFIDTAHGFLSETSAILDYLEDEYPARPLLPSGSYERAFVRSLTRQLELYIELPARACFGAALVEQSIDEATRQRAQRDLLEGIAALKRAAQFGPYLAGDRFTLADIVFVFTVPAAMLVAHKVHHVDLLDDFAEARSLLTVLRQRPHVQTITSKRKEARAGYLAWRQSIESSHVER